MKTIIITGSTRGIGYGLADAFLALGCNIMVSGRTWDAVHDAPHQPFHGVARYALPH